MNVSDETAAEIRAAQAEHTRAIAAARAALLEEADTAIASGQLTTAAAAKSIGVSRVTLSRQLNAARATGRPGGGRAEDTDLQAAASLALSRERRDAAIEQADAMLLAIVGRAIEERRASISAAAELLGIDRGTLTEALAERRGAAPR